VKIYGFPTFNVSKVLLSAEEIGLDYEFVFLNPREGEHKLPDHMARHPLGKVPALEHKGRHLFEGAAICRYMARVANSSLYEGDDFQLAVIDAWIDMANLHVGRWLGSMFFNEIVNVRILGNPVNEEAVAEAKNWLEQQMPALDNQLESNRFITGDSITTAFVQISDVTSFSLDAFPNVVRWFNEMKARPAFDRAMANFPGGKLLGT
jgi:glutathione S-transferase